MSFGFGEVCIEQQLSQLLMGRAYLTLCVLRHESVECVIWWSSLPKPKVMDPGKVSSRVNENTGRDAGGPRHVGVAQLDINANELMGAAVRERNAFRMT